MKHWRQKDSPMLSPLKTCRIVVAPLFLSIFALGAIADPAASPWSEKDLTEPFMRSISKRQCMEKTVASLKSGCTSDQCLKNLSGVAGDCITWATGDAAEFCSSYTREYISRYCATNELDARRCVLLHVVRPLSCAPK